MQKYKVSMNVSTNILLTKKTKKKMRYYFQMRYTGHALRVMLTSLWWEVTMAAPRESMCCEQCGKLRASGCSTHGTRPGAQARATCQSSLPVAEHSGPLDPGLSFQCRTPSLRGGSWTRLRLLQCCTAV